MELNLLGLNISVPISIILIGIFSYILWVKYFYKGKFEKLNTTNKVGEVSTIFVVIIISFMSILSVVGLIDLIKNFMFNYTNLNFLFNLFNFYTGIIFFILCIFFLNNWKERPTKQKFSKGILAILSIQIIPLGIMFGLVVWGLFISNINIYTLPFIFVFTLMFILFIISCVLLYTLMKNNKLLIKNSNIIYWGLAIFLLFSVISFSWGTLNTVSYTQEKPILRGYQVSYSSVGYIEKSLTLKIDKFGKLGSYFNDLNLNFGINKLDLDSIKSKYFFRINLINNKNQLIHTSDFNMIGQSDNEYGISQIHFFNNTGDLFIRFDRNVFLEKNITNITIDYLEKATTLNYSFSSQSWSLGNNSYFIKIDLDNKLDANLYQESTVIAGNDEKSCNFTNFTIISSDENLLSNKNNNIFCSDKKCSFEVRSNNTDFSLSTEINNNAIRFTNHGMDTPVKLNITLTTKCS